MTPPATSQGVGDAHAVETHLGHLCEWACSLKLADIDVGIQRLGAALAP